MAPRAPWSRWCGATASTKRVEVGLMSGGQVEIRDGLAEGDMVWRALARYCAKAIRCGRLRSARTRSNAKPFLVTPLFHHDQPGHTREFPDVERCQSGGASSGLRGDRNALRQETSAGFIKARELGLHVKRRRLDRLKDHLVADLADPHFGALEAKIPGQLHGLGAAVHEQFGG